MRRVVDTFDQFVFLAIEELLKRSKIKMDQVKVQSMRLNYFRHQVPAQFRIEWGPGTFSRRVPVRGMNTNASAFDIQYQFPTLFLIASGIGTFIDRGMLNPKNLDESC